MSEQTGVISQLFIYPVKSCKGIPVARSELRSTGLALDRFWMIVDEQGKFMSQRQCPNMALIHTELTKSDLILSHATCGSITIPLAYKGPGRILATKVWRNECSSLDEGDVVAAWLQNALGLSRKVRMVRMAKGFTRDLAHPSLEPTLHADAAPFLIVAQSSLDSLNTRLEDQGFRALPIDRFRPNIVVDNVAPFSEHTASVMTSEVYSFALCYPCERCIVTTIEQSNAKVDPSMQPLVELASLNPMPSKRAPAFGQNAIVTKNETRRICVGEKVVFS